MQMIKFCKKNEQQYVYPFQEKLQELEQKLLDLQQQQQKQQQ